MQAMVLTVIGRDKSGLIKDIASAIDSCDGRWLRSSFCHLGGQFAGFVEVQIDSEQQNSLIQKCHALSNLQITLTPANNEDEHRPKHIKVSITGNDRNGIVNDISSTLKSYNINIQEMETRCESAANWGSLLFSASLLLHCPDDIETSVIKDAIENLADDLIVEFE